MTKDEAYTLVMRSISFGEASGSAFIKDEQVLKIVDSIFDYVEQLEKEVKNWSNKSCESCKWLDKGGEFENDTCSNTSISAHLPEGTMVSSDFCCNRHEESLPSTTTEIETTKGNILVDVSAVCYAEMMM